jgi:opacity protein-like surface antigen
MLCVALAAPAVAAAVGVYFDGGLAAYGDLVTEISYRGYSWKNYEDLGSSYWVGGGLAVPVWRYPAAVSPYLELATDVGFSTKAKEIGVEDETYELSFKAIPVRENLIFGVTAGPAKPFVGFGAGVAVVPWTATHVATGAEIDSQTEVKAGFGIPFGCEFRLAPNLALAARADYLIITGEATPEIQQENVRTFMPNLFLLTGMARVDF